MTQPPDFTGDLDGYLAWAADTWSSSSILCPRHWAPCPVEGRPGLLISVLLQVELMTRMPPDVGDATGMNSWAANRLTPLCCELGDDAMTWLWDELDRPHCGHRPPEGHRMAGGRVCWYEPDHTGPHEYDKPGSVFALRERQA